MKMKKLAALALSAVFALGALTACGGSSSSGSVPAAASASGSGSVSGASLKEVNIGLIQLMEHASLDEIRTAIEAGLEAKGAEYGVKVNVDYQNAQGDTSTINTICQQFVGNKVDAIVAIATPAAQGAATAVAGTDIPVIFSAVTDPAAAGLVENLEAPEGNITGTSDAIPVEKIFELAAELTPDAESFGLIYNTGEVNSVSVIDETKAYLDAQGISYTEASVASTGDVQTAAQTLLSKCDAIFAPIDNTVASHGCAGGRGHQGRKARVCGGRQHGERRRPCHRGRQLHQPGHPDGRHAAEGPDGHARLRSACGGLKGERRCGE